MNKIVIFLIVSILTLELSGCADTTKQDQGVLGGAAIGGLVGSRFGHGGGRVATTAAGVLIGAIVGGEVGRSMDKVDRMETYRALESTPTNQTRRWTNPDSNVQYKVTPTKTYYQQSDVGSTQPCREYTTNAVIGGKQQQVYGTACRMDDGSWKIVSTH